MKDRTRKILFWIIILIGIVVRVIGWPNSFEEVNCDEVMTALNAKEISETGKDIYGTSFPVYLESWGYSGQSVMLAYITAIFIKLFGANIFSVRLPLLLISIISLFVIYDLCKRIFKNKDVALIILALSVICPWHIMQSRWSMDCNLFPHFMLIAVDLLVIGIQKNKNVLYLSMIVFALSMYTYGLSIYVVPFFLLIMAIYLVRKKQVSVKELLICILIYLLISAPIILMYIVNFLGLDDIKLGPITIQHFEYMQRTGEMLIFKDNKIDSLILNLERLIKLLFVQYDKLPWNSIYGIGTIYTISMLFAIVGLYFMCTKKDNDYMVLFTWLIASVILALNIDYANVNKLNIIWYPLLILAGYGIYVLVNTPKLKKILSIIVIIAYTVLFAGFNYKYYAGHINVIENSLTWSNGLNRALKYATNLDKSKIKLYGEDIENTTTNVYVGYNVEFYKDNKEYSVYNMEPMDDESIYIIRKENMKEEFKDYNCKEFLQYVVVYK